MLRNCSHFKHHLRFPRWNCFILWKIANKMDDFPCTPDLFSPSSSSSSSSPGKITLSKSSHTVYDTHRHVYLHIQTAIPGYDHKIHQLPTNSVTLHSLLEKKLLRINRKRRKQLTMDDLEWKARMINSIYPKRQIKITWVVDPTKSEDDCYVNVGVPVRITRRYAERKRTDLA